jgi:DNA-binding MarR family transcriptional regulator
METVNQDAIDVAVAQWADQRPDLDVGPMAVVERISRANHLLERALKTNFAKLGVEPWEYDVLATLRRHGGGPLTSSELVASAGVTSSSMTNRIDRLVSKGLVTRQVDPANRRSLQIELTADGRTLVDDVVAAHVGCEARLLSRLGPTNQQRLAVLLRKLLLTLGDEQR